MAKIGYIMTAPGYEDFSADSGWMENFGCVEIVREELLSGDKARTQWDSLMARIQFGDTVVIPKLSNAYHDKSYQNSTRMQSVQIEIQTSAVPMPKIHNCRAQPNS